MFEWTRAWFYTIQHRAQNILKVKEHFSRTIYSAANTRRRSPGWVYLGNNDLGDVCSLCPQHPHYCSQESLVSSLEMETFCDILLIHIVSFESLWVSEPTQKLRRASRFRPFFHHIKSTSSRSRARLQVWTCCLCRCDEWRVGWQGRNYTTNLWLFPLATSPHTEITAIIAALSESKSRFRARALYYFGVKGHV